MRVTFVLPEANLSGGVRVVAIYAERLRRRGHHVTVVSVPEAPRTLRDRLWHLRYGYGWLPRERSGPSHLDALPIEHRKLESRRAVEDRDVPDADVIVATWWETAEWVSRLSAAKGAPVYFLQHDEIEFYAQASNPEKLRARVAATCALPMRKIVVAQWIADRIRERGVTHPVRVIPNSVDLEQFNAPPRGKRPVPTVGLIYSHTYFKGYDLMLQAIRRGRAELPALDVVAFSSEEPDKFLPLPEGTRFSHRPEQGGIRDLYAACDAWLFASRSEGFGLPLLEAMACRTPVIGAPAGAAPELLAGGGGVLLSSANAGEMGEAIVRIARMPDAEWRAMSDLAFETATRYTWDDATALLEEELSAALGRPHAKPAGAAVGVPA
jgi:glycosyltransferase involved in cell wall biosynthesis